jgi:hypothetical protein
MLPNKPLGDNMAGDKKYGNGSQQSKHNHNAVPCARRILLA